MTLGKLQGILRWAARSSESLNGLNSQSPAALLTGHLTCRISVNPAFIQHVRASSQALICPQSSLLSVQSAHTQQKCYKRKLFPDPFEQDPEYFLPPEENYVNLDLNHVPVLKNRGPELVERVMEAACREELGRLFAVVHVDGQQRKVTSQDLLLIHGFFPPQIGDQIRLEKVMMVGSKHFTLFGRPLLDRDLVRVEATVIEKTLSHRSIHFTKFKRSRRTKLLQHPQTVLVVNSVSLEPKALHSLGHTVSRSDTQESTQDESQSTNQTIRNT